MVTAAVASRKLLALKAGHFMLVGVIGTMGYLIDARLRHLVPWLEHPSHVNLPAIAITTVSDGH